MSSKCCICGDNVSWERTDLELLSDFRFEFCNNCNVRLENTMEIKLMISEFYNIEWHKEDSSRWLITDEYDIIGIYNGFAYNYKLKNNNIYNVARFAIHNIKICNKEIEKIKNRFADYINDNHLEFLVKTLSFEASKTKAKKRGYFTFKEISDALNISQQKVSKIFNGVRPSCIDIRHIVNKIYMYDKKIFN